MKAIIALMSLIMICSFGWNAEARRGQVVRTAKGIQNGSINKEEAKKIGKKRRRARRVERRALRDGEVTQAEKRRIRRSKRRTGVEIYKSKNKD